MGYLWLEDILGLLRVPSQRVIVTPGHETVRLGLFLVDERLLLPLALDGQGVTYKVASNTLFYHLSVSRSLARPPKSGKGSHYQEK